LNINGYKRNQKYQVYIVFTDLFFQPDHKKQYYSTRYNRKRSNPI